jgi:ABC-2 type transport system permease protein
MTEKEEIKMLTIWGKELRAYFYSINAYIFMGTFLLITGIFFSLFNLMQADNDYNGMLQSITNIFLFLVPLLTMKIVSEETRSKTDQLLLTSPVKVESIIIGKYFAAVTLYILTLLFTVLYPLILSKFGKLVLSEIFSGYVGLVLLGTSFIAIGLFISSLTESQIIAAVGTFGALLLIFILDMIQKGLPTGRDAGITFAVILAVLAGATVYFITRNIFAGALVLFLGIIALAAVFVVNNTVFDGFIVKFFGWFSLLKRYEKFSLGILSLDSVLYYLSFSTAFVFLAIRVIDKRRWS